MMKAKAIRDALAHAPRVTIGSRHPTGLQGWEQPGNDPQTVCVHCADRLIKRGCAGLLSGFDPVWDRTVECHFSDTHSENIQERG